MTTRNGLSLTLGLEVVQASEQTSQLEAVYPQDIPLDLQRKSLWRPRCTSDQLRVPVRASEDSQVPGRDSPSSIQSGTPGISASAFPSLARPGHRTLLIPLTP